LWASGVGFLTIGLAVLFHWKATDRRLARLAWLALVLVIVQGILGGLRVSLMKDQIGVFHASLAQAFLVLLIGLSVATSAWWQRWCAAPVALPRGLARWVGWVTAAIFVQLIVGASMRHQHAGLAIPDFPLAYGRLWPSVDEAFLQQVNALRTDVRDFHPITAGQIHLHMVHRLLGLALGVAVLATSRAVRRAAGASSTAGRWATAWGVLILLQASLGAFTVWTNKAADIATAHVVTGAACLAVGAITTALCRVGARASQTCGAILPTGSSSRVTQGVGSDLAAGRPVAVQEVHG
jgi:cytochrome c oxidase assembly protein subunit 15